MLVGLAGQHTAGSTPMNGAIVMCAAAAGAVLPCLFLLLNRAFSALAFQDFVIMLGAAIIGPAAAKRLKLPAHQLVRALSSLRLVMFASRE